MSKTISVSPDSYSPPVHACFRSPIISCTRRADPSNAHSDSIFDSRAVLDRGRFQCTPAVIVPCVRAVVAEDLVRFSSRRTRVHGDHVFVVELSESLNDRSVFVEESIWRVVRVCREEDRHRGDNNRERSRRKQDSCHCRQSTHRWRTYSLPEEKASVQKKKKKTWRCSMALWSISFCSRFSNEQSSDTERAEVMGSELWSKCYLNRSLLHLVESKINIEIEFLFEVAMIKYLREKITGRPAAFSPASDLPFDE